jgi:hypothetical protein
MFFPKILDPAVCGSVPHSAFPMTAGTHFLASLTRRFGEHAAVDELCSEWWRA